MTDAPDRDDKSYDHNDAFSAAFGINDARWFLAKAGRELARYHAAKDLEDRTDNLLNFANSVIALEDWALPNDVENESGWRGELRCQSPAHAFMALIALVAKHRRVNDGRFSKLRIKNGQIQFWTEEPVRDSLMNDLQHVVPSARIKTIRTHIDDDQIEGYTVIVDVAGLMHEGKLLPVDAVMMQALDFWEGVFTARDLTGQVGVRD